MKSGTVIRLVQELLEHSRIKTTKRQTLVSNKNIQHVKSLLDDLDLPGGKDALNFLDTEK
jgi:site-specific recombinase XerC